MQAAIFHSWITKQHSTCQKLGHTNSIIATIFNIGAWIIRSETYFTALAWHHIFSGLRAFYMVLIENSSYFSPDRLSLLKMYIAAAPDKEDLY